jgi:hypothetical protein
MPPIDFEDGKLTLPTRLTKGQISKFNISADNIVVDGNSVYISIEKLHGILLTNSNQSVQGIINNYYGILRAHIVKDQTNGKFLGVRPIGLYILLEQLATDKPQRAVEYRASLSLVSYLVSANQKVDYASEFASREINAEVNKIAAKLKSIHSICQLSRIAFAGGEEKHAHHIVAASIAPNLIASPENILIVKKSVHNEYHQWVAQNKLSIDRPSLIKYAQSNDYSTDYSHDLN